MDKFSKGDKINAAMTTSDVSCVIDSIKKNGKKQEVQVNECQELKKLREKCCDTNISAASAAFQGIAQLTEGKIISCSHALTSLTSLVPSVCHYTPLVITIGNILLFDIQEKIRVNGRYICPYNFTDRPHPFIILLKHDAGKSWDVILCYIHCLLHKNKQIKFELKLHLLRTVFLYIFCDPTPNSMLHKNELFSLLLEELNRSEMKHFLIQALAWQKIDANYCWLIQKIFRRLLSSPDSEAGPIIAALTPCLAAAIKWRILNGRDPVLWIDLLSESLKINDTGASAALYILSDVIMECPALFINYLVDLCSGIMYSFTCNKYTAYKFAAVSLVWLVNPSSLADRLFKNLEDIIKFLSSTSKNQEWNKQRNKLHDLPFINIVQNSDSEVKTGIEMATLSDQWNDSKTSVLKWLKYVSASNNSAMQTKLNSFIAGIVMFSSDDEIEEVGWQILLEVSNGNSHHSFFQLCLIFYKLCREIEPRRQLKHLQCLSKMAKSKGNIPLIIGIIETFKNDRTQIMLPVVIDLYLKLWKVDSRTYPYLQKVLFSSSSHGESSWEINVMKTVALREICKSSPEVYGKSLVSKLSEVLNDCDNYVSGLPSAIAIEAVIELCKASVIDISGTWKALKPKLSQDKRTEVIVSLCKLFGEISALQPCATGKDWLIDDVIPRLWNYALSENLKIIKAALGALSKFNTESYGPKLLPDLLKVDIEIPKQYCKTTSDTARKDCLDELQYIPGECWIELIRKIDLKVTHDAGNMLSKLIEKELTLLPRRFFCHPEEVPEPKNYSHLPHSSICRALVLHIKNFLNSQTKGKNVPFSIVESLRILSCDYSKCLPVLDWSFLGNFFGLNETCERYAVGILAKQAVISKASRNVLENYVKDNLQRFNEVSDFMFLYSLLSFACNSLTANTLRQFLDRTIKSTCQSSLNSGTDHFENLLASVKITLDSRLVPEPRKALLVTQVQNILSQIPPGHKIMMKYANFAVDLPPKTIEYITSPSSWPKITRDKIQRAVHIRSAIASQQDSSNPLAWFNECIDAVADLPDEHNFIINNIANVIRKKQDMNHGSWLVELMWRIQTSTSSVNTPESMRMTLFLLDIFISSTTTISGYDCFLCDSDQQGIRKKALNFFPPALYELLSRSEYSSLSSKVIEWLHSLSNWKNMSTVYTEMLEQAILILRSNEYCSEKNKWLNIFYLPSMNCPSTS